MTLQELFNTLPETLRAFSQKIADLESEIVAHRAETDSHKQRVEALESVVLRNTAPAGQGAAVAAGIDAEVAK